MYIKFTDDTKPSLEKVWILLRLERPYRVIWIEWRAITSYMKFNKNKSQILYLGQVNPGYPNKLAEERLERSPTERDLGVSVADSLHMTQQCALVAKRAKRVLGCSKYSTAPVASRGR